MLGEASKDRQTLTQGANSINHTVTSLSQLIGQHNILPNRPFLTQFTTIPSPARVWTRPFLHHRRLFIVKTAAILVTQFTLVVSILGISLDIGFGMEQSVCEVWLRHVHLGVMKGGLFGKYVRRSKILLLLEICSIILLPGDCKLLRSADGHYTSVGSLSFHPRRVCRVYSYSQWSTVVIVWWLSAIV